MKIGGFLLLWTIGFWGSIDGSHADSCSGLPDCHSDTPTIIENYGFRPENHTCRTTDGFHLTLHRIRQHPPQNQSRGAVLLLHGLLDSSSTWVMNGRKGSLGFILADSGFDVWLGNSRGNSYSSKHDTLQPSDNKFWKWSWDEMARYDLPAMVEYVCGAAGVEKISLVGHSQGTMQAFAALATHDIAKQLAPQLNLFVALAPVAFLRGLSSPLLRALADVDADALVALFGSGLQRLLLSAVFAVPSVRWLEERARAHTLALTAGGWQLSGCVPGARSHVNHTRWPVYSAHYPSGSSVQNIEHFAQGVRAGSFRRFDFGTIRNLQHYHSFSPPPYTLAQVQPVPTALFSGKLDTLASPQDVATIVQELPAGMVVWREELQTWDHLTFVWGEDASAYLYPKVRALIEEHTRTPGERGQQGAAAGAWVEVG